MGQFKISTGQPAIKIMKEAGTHAVKMEGSEEMNQVFSRYIEYVKNGEFRNEDEQY